MQSLATQKESRPRPQTVFTSCIILPSFACAIPVCCNPFFAPKAALQHPEVQASTGRPKASFCTSQRGCVRGTGGPGSSAACSDAAEKRVESTSDLRPCRSNLVLLEAHEHQTHQTSVPCVLGVHQPNSKQKTSDPQRILQTRSTRSRFHRFRRSTVRPPRDLAVSVGLTKRRSDNDGVGPFVPWNMGTVPNTCRVDPFVPQKTWVHVGSTRLMFHGVVSHPRDHFAQYVFNLYLDWTSQPHKKTPFSLGKLVRYGK